MVQLGAGGILGGIAAAVVGLAADQLALQAPPAQAAGQAAAQQVRLWRLARRMIESSTRLGRHCWTIERIGPGWAAGRGSGSAMSAAPNASTRWRCWPARSSASTPSNSRHGEPFRNVHLLPDAGCSRGSSAVATAPALHPSRPATSLAKVRQADQDAVKACYWQLFDDIDAEPGAPALAEARRRAEAFPPGGVPAIPQCGRLPARHPAQAQPATCAAHASTGQGSATPDRADLRRDQAQRQGIGRLPGERSCLALVWAVHAFAARGWRGVD
jgi:hypothetical protein